MKLTSNRYRPANRILKLMLVVPALAVLMLASALPVRPASAAGVDIKAWPGLSGLYKMDQAVQIKLELINSGEPFKGKLVVDREKIPGQPEQGGNKVLYSREIDVQSGKTSTIMLVPGNVMGLPPEVKLVSGERVLARTPVQGTNVSGGLIGLVLSEKAYRSDLFTWLDKRLGNQFNAKYMNPEELPDNAVLLQGADLLVVDRDAVKALNGEQCQAIMEWTRLGGTLLLSGGAGAEQGGKFSAISPVAVQGNTRASGAMGGLRPDGGSLNAASGKLVSGRVVASEAGNPLMVYGDLGRGKVVYSAVALEELGGNNEKLWLALDDPDGLGVFSQRRIKEPQVMRDMLANASSYLPQLDLPPVPAVMLIWVVYLAAAGPGIYYLLKRYDRRDLAWITVPVLAVATAGGFYLFSPVNRLQGYLEQTLTAVDILGPGLAEVRSAETLVLPRGGNLKLQAVKDMMVEPVNYYNSGQGDNRLEIVNNGQVSSINFQGVEYGSMRQVAAYGLWREAGTLEGAVYFRKDTLMGEITNNTGINLRDCKLLAGGHLIELGSLGAGQTRDINEMPDRWQLVGSREALAGSPGDTRMDDDVREKRLLDELINQNSQEQDGVMFLAWGDNPTELFSVVEPSARGRNYGLMLIRQKIDINIPAGEFKIPAGLLGARENQVEGGLEKRADGIIMHNGKAVLSYDLADIMGGRKYTVSRIAFPGSVEGHIQTLEVYSHNKQNWVELKDGQRVLEGQEAAGCISPQGTVKIRISGGFNGNEALKIVPFRGIEVEGVAE
ncbi:hypothetical protein DCCM_3733 [Desulfocucumis palustris]|uniref:Uncharacterized protein n=1 Tax=Desulfocucumis palustris TaxID=1898651 RepID=A0A2L2XF14_9FIRM|nr:hypothetical protein [Desulfocucumis palustris]GBF34614.1 hypothetical protein DCCM_3733 [Desulfocucumis palustris]